MHITKISLENYRSFHEQTEIPLSTGINLILGENNSGKSSILDALSPMEFRSSPHLSETTKPHAADSLPPQSKAELTITLEKNEPWLYLGEQFFIPVPNDQVEVYKNFPRYISKLEKIEFIVGTTSSGQTSSHTFFRSIINGKQYGPTHPGMGGSTLYSIKNRQLEFGQLDNHGDAYAALESQCQFLFGRFYRFKAERLNIHRHSFGSAQSLRSDASNLPECLNSLQSGNPYLFNEYNEYVKKVFPSVHRIQVTPSIDYAQNVEIRVWLTPPSTRRSDISIPLSQCGTGIGQVLAILYVALSATVPLAIAIDEPNSFLHPKAVRTLLQILNSLEMKHQYIITTHSPEVIRSSEASTITTVANENGVSKINVLSPSSLDDIRKGLASIGTRLSDVYGADQILWVEGETEEITFPRIASEISKIKIVGISILKVNSTGDFESRKTRPRMVFNVYQNLSKSGALIPPAIGFIFDNDGRTDNEISDLTRESAGSVTFLPRFCFENYILDPKAIAEILSGTTGKSISESDIEEWIRSNGMKPEYFASKFVLEDGGDVIRSNAWLSCVHGAKLLKDLFRDLPESPEEYRKTSHSVAITEWLIQNDPTFLAPLAELIEKTLSPHLDSSLHRS